MDERTVELNVLGAILKRPSIIGSVPLEPEDFGYLPYRSIYQAMQGLYKDGINIDTITLADALGSELKDVNIHDAPSTLGRSALIALRDEANPDNHQQYSNIVKNNAKNRQIMALLSEGATWITKGRNPADVLHDLSSKINHLQVDAGESRTISFLEAIERAKDMTDKASKGTISYTKTGFTRLDKIIIGLTGPDLIYVAARPGVGKTAFLASTVYNIMQNYRKHIVYFSLEMGSEQVGMRFISMDSGINFHAQRTGQVDWEKYNTAVEKFRTENYPLYLNDLPRLTPTSIRKELRKFEKVDLLVVDYLQLAEPDEKYQQRHQEVAAVSRALKQIAREFNIPVVCAAQLSRAAIARAKDEQRPVLSDLAESSALEKDADIIIFLHRVETATDTEVIVAKHRNGPVGGVHLTYLADKTKFVNQTGVI